MISEFGEQFVKRGDVILLSSNTLCGCVPEGYVRITSLRLDTDYVIDQVFWQYVTLLADRLDAKDLTRELFAEPAQIFHLGEERVSSLLPVLDELVALSVEGKCIERFFRMEALLFAIVDVVMPDIRTTPVRISKTQRQHGYRTSPRQVSLSPLRVEARTVRNLLNRAIADQWTLEGLAERVHLSSKQLSRVFVDAYGKTPLAYLTMLRVEAMARLLRETDLSIAAAGHAVGWESRSRTAEAFRQCVGVTPRRYRTLCVRPDRR